MKTLLLLRHAKSSWSNSNSNDFERPLNKRGVLSAGYMVEHLKEKGLFPNKVLCSASKRTQETISLMKNDLDLEGKIVFKEDLYHADYQTILTQINAIDNSIDTLMVVAHNPGLSQLLHYLTGDFINLVTCGIAHITFPLDDWNAVFEYTGELKQYDFPKNHETFRLLLASNSN